MINLEQFLEDIQKFCPPLVTIFCEQSQQAQQKILEIFAKHASLVTLEEYERQREFCRTLSARCNQLEKKISELSYPKTAPDHFPDV
jgi:GTP-dependent phosphoenolpyruvate carboxykinase